MRVGLFRRRSFGGNDGVAVGGKVRLPFAGGGRAFGAPFRGNTHFLVQTFLCPCGPATKASYFGGFGRYCPEEQGAKSAERSAVKPLLSDFYSSDAL